MNTVLEYGTAVRRYPNVRRWVIRVLIIVSLLLGAIIVVGAVMSNTSKDIFQFVRNDVEPDLTSTANWLKAHPSVIASTPFIVGTIPEFQGSGISRRFAKHTVCYRGSEGLTLVVFVKYGRQEVVLQEIVDRPRWSPSTQRGGFDAVDFPSVAGPAVTAIVLNNAYEHWTRGYPWLLKFHPDRYF